MAYVRRVLPYVYRGVLYVYSLPCTLPPQKQKQERIVKTPDKSDKRDRSDSGIVKNQGPLYEAKTTIGGIRIRRLLSWGVLLATATGWRHAICFRT